MSKDTQIQKKKTSSRRGINQAKLALVLFCAVLLVCGGIALMIHLQNQAALQDDETLGTFEVKSVTASGSVRYSQQQLIEASQIVVGQSIFRVDEERAVSNLLQKFPYLDTVNIDTPTYDTVHITVTESRPEGELSANTAGWFMTLEIPQEILAEANYFTAG